MKLNLLNRIMGSKAEKKAQRATHKRSVLRATQINLERYAKTFKDLALYDRGEKASNPVSR